MKVGFYIGATGPETGGGFTIVHEVMRALAAKKRESRHEFVMLTLAEQTAERAAPEGLEQLSIRDAFFERPFGQRVDGLMRRQAARLLDLHVVPDGRVGSRPALEALLTEHGFDVIWYPSAWDCCTLEIPFVTVVWDLQHRLQPFFPEVSDDGKWTYREEWMSTVLRRAALVVAGTEVGRHEIERFYGVPRERIRLMPHPTPAFATRVADAPASRPVAGDYLFYPAQFWPHKNHVNLLHALDLLRRQDHLDLSLVLTGSDQGNLAHVRSTASALGLADHVRILGFVPQEELAALYRHAFALAYVTFFGPENLPPLEAFAAGCPVVASDVPGAREQLGDAALLVDPRSPEKIAAAVKSLFADRALRDGLVVRGLQRAQLNTAEAFVAGVDRWLDEFEPVRRCWPSGVYAAGKRRFP